MPFSKAPAMGVGLPSNSCEDTVFRSISKPNEGEYAPYAIMYIKLVPDDGQVLNHLQKNFEQLRQLILPLPEERLRYRYAEGKWTIKDIVLHVCDTERIFAYRALRFARGDATGLPGFEQEDYARTGGANERSVQDLLLEFATVRSSTLALFNSLPDESLSRSGTANGRLLTVRAAAYHIAGHELHHVNIINERYLGGTP